MPGIYLHIPFCKQACHYCDFHFSTDRNASNELIAAMVSELDLQKDYIHGTVNTIYLGGGTPSLLNQKELGLLFDSIYRNYSVSDDAEITVEANPDDLSKEKLKILRDAGVNRLSVGIQTFNDQLLKFLNRAHDSAAAIRCLDLIREEGFNNVSVDMIYAIPGLSQEMWQKDLSTVLQHSPAHISSYALTIEERTVFGNWNKRGKLHAMEEEQAARQFEILMDTLEQAGYEQYEISNFCRPGLYSKHNSSYWKGESYLGVGPSAHSYNKVSRQFNVRNNAAYLRAIHEKRIPYDLEVLTDQNKINEYILTTLRTMWGCDLNVLKNHLGDDLLSRCGEYLSLMQDQKLLSISENILRLTRKGKLVADKIAEDLMVSS